MSYNGYNVEDSILFNGASMIDYLERLIFLHTMIRRINIRKRCC